MRALTRDTHLEGGGGQQAPVGGAERGSDIFSQQPPRPRPLGGQWSCGGRSAQRGRVGTRAFAAAIAIAIAIAVAGPGLCSSSIGTGSRGAVTSLPASPRGAAIGVRGGSGSSDPEPHANGARILADRLLQFDIEAANGGHVNEGCTVRTILQGSEQPRTCPEGNTTGSRLFCTARRWGSGRPRG